MNLGSALGIPKEVYVHLPDNRLVLPSCRVGLEFEFEGVRAALPLKSEDWTAYWVSKVDPSLHDNGMEYVFRNPSFGTDAIDAIVALCAFAKKNKFKVSIRTGLHVHIDVRDLTRKQLSVLLSLYALFEKAIYRFIGNRRDENVFCLPWYKADQAAVHANNVCSDWLDVKTASEALEQEKYGGLNLDTLARFGSLEFRHAIATTNDDWVIKWVNVCLSLKRAAQKLDTTPLELIHNLSAIGVEAFAHKVFEDQFEVLWYANMEVDVWATGIETALAVLPQQQKVIDKAGLAWNIKKKLEIKGPINPSFKTYWEKHAKKDDGPLNPYQLRADEIIHKEWYQHYGVQLQPLPGADLIVMDEHINGPQEEPNF